MNKLIIAIVAVAATVPMCGRRKEIVGWALVPTCGLAKHPDNAVVLGLRGHECPYVMSGLP